jgi:NAD(P)-dependent dehydrogenase (short-subunit alcohol dehydrogenase family)
MVSKFGNVDVLLNNAGYGAYGPLEAFSREKIVRQFNTNVIDFRCYQNRFTSF